MPPFPASATSWDSGRKDGKNLSDLARPRDPRAREAHQTAGREEGKRGRWVLALLTTIWRHRRTLAPFGATLGLVATAAAGHAASEGLAWAPLVVGAVAGGAILVGAHRPIHVRYAAGVGLAGLWTAAAWWVGLADPLVLGGLLVGVAAAAVVWIRHHHPRARVRVRGGSSWPWFGDRWGRWQFQRRARREVGRAMASWEVASYWGKVPRSRIRAADADIEEDFWLLTVELVAGHIVIDLDNRRAASAIGAPARDVRIVDQGRDSDSPANVVLIEWYFDGLELAAPGGEEEGDDERPEPDDLVELRTQMLQHAVERAGARVVSARQLAKLANLPHDWVARWIRQLAPALGLQRVAGGWQKLAVEEEEAS